MPYHPFGQFGESFSSPDTVDFRNVRGGIVTSREFVVAGGTQGVIRSRNYDPTNELGWAIFGDGSASFYGDLIIGANAIVLGDVYSANWNGSIPANLSSRDGGASVGYYFDSSQGAAQFEGSLYLGGDLLMSSGSTFKTAESGDRIEIGGSDAFISLYDATSGLVGQIGWAASGFGTNDLVIENQSGIGDVELHAAGGIELDASGSAGIGVHVTNPDPAGGLPGRPFRVKEGTGSGFQVYDSNSVSTPTWAFANDTDTGIYRHTTNTLGFAAGGVTAFTADSGGINMNDKDIDMGGSGSILNALVLEMSEVRATDFGPDSDPPFTFDGDEDTGMYRVTTNTLGFTAGGRGALELNSNGTVSVTPSNADGRVALVISIERSWEFRQRGTGASTSLVMASTSNKPLYIRQDNNGDVAKFHTSDIRFPGRATTTNSGLAAWRNDGFPGDELLALSSSKEDKKEIRDANTQKYLKRIDQLRPREYKSRLPKDDGRKVFLGLVKEEAQKVWPDWTYEAMTVPLLIATQDLRKRVTELEEQVAALQK